MQKRVNITIDERLHELFLGVCESDGTKLSNVIESLLWVELSLREKACESGCHVGFTRRIVADGLIAKGQYVRREG